MSSIPIVPTPNLPPLGGGVNSKTLQRPKLLMMIHWKESGKWDLYQAIMGCMEKLEILQPFGLNRFRSNFWNRLTYILSEFYLPLAALMKRDSFDIVMSWSMRLGICYGVLNRLFRRSGSPKHIIYDFHIDLTRTDWIYRFRLKLLRFAIPGIDFFFTTSEKEIEIYARLFGIRPDLMAFWPMTPAAYLLKKDISSRGDYLFSYGNSDRDYDMLIQAVKNLPVQTVIVSRTYQPTYPLPSGIVLIREKPWDELLALIESSRMVILPLKSYNVAAGQLCMLETLALGRPLIVTRNMATVEYAVDGKTALFFDAKDAETLSDHIRYLLDYPDAAETMGQTARKAVGGNAARRLAALMDALNRLLNRRA
jgi:glycosyltransferase involved in cell wall biosynthesis